MTVTSELDAKSPFADSQTGAVSFGHYQILELIGAGGMAEVYRATSRGPGGFEKPVVIKRVKPKHSGDPAFVRMFVDEAKLSAQLQHPNIVTVFEFGEIDGHHYIAMEYIDGLHLQAAHVRHMQLLKGPLPWQACLLIARDMLFGLDYAHEKVGDDGEPLGLVHRDINLVNVMVGRGGAVKVLDFGIVKAAGGIRSAETVGSVLKGKFGYMSPEQAEGRALDRRSDVFSAAIVLHELLTGRRLFWGEDDLVILRKVCGGEIVDPRAYRPEIPAAAAEITMRGLARDLDVRYPTAGAMADALEEVIAASGIMDGALRMLMEELLPPEATEASEHMRQRRRRVTMMAWASGVKDVPPPERAVSGVLSSQDRQATTAGKKAGVIGATPQGSEGKGTLITSEPRWLAPEAEVEGVEIPLVLGEQDTTVVTEAPVGDPLLDEATRILVGEEAEGGPLSGAERALFTPTPSAPAGTLGASSEKTQILGGEEAPTVILPEGEAASALLGAVSPRSSGAQAAAVSTPSDSASPESATPAREVSAREPPVPRKASGSRIVLAVTLVAVLAGLALYLMCFR